VSTSVSKILLMSHKEERFIFIGHGLEEEIDHWLGRDTIEVSGWLIGKNDVRVHDKRASDSNALFLAP
jgi:hypothetical protein